MAADCVQAKSPVISTANSTSSASCTKGRKDRHVMLPPEVLDLLRQWWKVRPARYDEGVPLKERWLFPGRKRGEPITTRQLSRLFHDAAEAAGIKKPVSLHSLRHSFAVV
jgi:integrase